MSISTLSPSTLVRWTQSLPDGALGFELRSSDNRLLQRAQQIFHPYLAAASTANDGVTTTTGPLRRFQIEKAAHDPDERLADAAPPDQWSVHCAGGTSERAEPSSDSPNDEAVPEYQTASNAPLALAMVEFAAVHAIAEYTQLKARQSVIGIHGALLQKDGKGILVVGHKEAGKSTLSCSLWQQGWSLLGDDYALLETGTAHTTSDDSPCAFATTRRVSLRPTSRTLLGETIWQQILDSPAGDMVGEASTGRLLFHPHEIDGQPRRHATPLRAIILLERAGSPAPAGELRRFESSQALFAMLPHVGLSHRDDLGPAMRLFGPIVNRVPTFDLRRGPLEMMTENLERVLETC